MEDAQQLDNPLDGSVAARLEEMRGKTMTVLKGKRDWYVRPRLVMRTLSFASRGIGVLGVIVGVATPPFVTMWSTADASKGLAVGYAALVIASVVLLFDQVFMFTRSWLRYTTAMSSLQDIIERFDEDWSALSVKSQQFPSGVVDVENALNVLKTAATDAIKVELTERSAWETQLNDGMQALRARVDAEIQTHERKREELGKRADEEQKSKAATEEADAKRALPCLLSVKVGGTAAVTPLLIEVKFADGSAAKAERSQVPSTAAFKGAAGPAHITVKKGPSKDTLSPVDEEFAILTPGERTQVTFA